MWLPLLCSCNPISSFFMAETILVPTDLRVASLNTLKLALELIDDDRVHVILVYAQYANDSITDLLFNSPKKRLNSLITAEFKEALEILRNRFEAKLLNGIDVEIYSGYNSNALGNFIDAFGVTQIFIPKTYRLALANKKAFDITPMLRKTKLPVFELAWGNHHATTEQEQLTTLFT